jgi:hypothetical protein
MNAIVIALTVINTTAWLLPDDTADKFGWGLRARLTAPAPPFLTHEFVWRGRLEVLLLNQMRDAREFAPRPDDPEASGILNLIIVRADGQEPSDRDYHIVPVRKARTKVPAGGVAASSYILKDFGYVQFHESGEHEMRVTLRMPEGLIFTPAVKFRVVEPAADAILASQAIPPDEEERKRPKEKRRRAAIQQIKVEGRTWLYLRLFKVSADEGLAFHACRLAELPGKLDMKVEGAWGGESGPLTITYKTSPTAEPTKLVINSLGWPWTEKDEKWWQEWLRKKSGLPPLAPAPNP